MKSLKSILALTLLVALVLPLSTALPAAAQPTTCLGCIGFPDGDAESGKMVNVTIGLSSLGDVGTDQPVFNISLEVSKSLYPTQFELWIFDGDMGDHWDRHQGTYDHITFSLYPDPDFEGNTTGAWRSWPGASMVNNGWWSVAVPHDPAALSPDGNWYRYHLVSEWVESGQCTGPCDDQQNNFKVSVQGTPFLLAGSTIGFEAFGPDPHTYPLHGPTTYQGWVRFIFAVPENTTEIDLYDGDADRADGGNPWAVPPIPGTEPSDTDDPNSPAPALAGPGCIPPPGTTLCWLPNCGDPDGVCPGTPPDYSYAFPPFQTSIETEIEGVNAGYPPDDNPYALYRREPGVYATVAPYPFDPAVHTGWPVTNDNPSGDKEWELFRIGLVGEALDPPPDLTVPAIPSGYYAWQFEGLDTHNTLFIHSTFDTYGPPATIGNTVWYDDDEDGFWDGNPLGSTEEPGIQGVKINLYRDADADRLLAVPPDVLLDSKDTDANGQYLFIDLTIDLNYIVQVDPTNFDPGGPLHDHYQTQDRSGEAGDHYNRHNPWDIFIPTNMDYVKADFGYREPTTDVSLASFTAGCQGDAAIVRWVTVSEIGTQGFNLYRAASWNGPWTKLNDNLIESKAPSGVLLGAEYSWLDESAASGIRYFYQLEQIDAGRTQWHGPAMVGCYWLYLPSLLRAR